MEKEMMMMMMKKKKKQGMRERGSPSLGRICEEEREKAMVGQRWMNHTSEGQREREREEEEEEEERKEEGDLRDEEEDQANPSSLHH